MNKTNEYLYREIKSKEIEVRKDGKLFITFIFARIFSILLYSQYRLFLDSPSAESAFLSLLTITTIDA